MLFLSLVVACVMGNQEQLFDRPIEAYLRDDNAFKVLANAESVKRMALDPSLVAELERDYKSMVDALSFALQSWDPNQGPEHEALVRRNLERKLNEISEKAISRLSPEQLAAFRIEKKKLMSYGYVFVADDQAVRLDDSQRSRLQELAQRANQRASTATRDHLSKIQIRNPQAYLAYKIFIDVDETRKARQVLGKEFCEQALSEQQRKQLQIQPPSNQE